MPEPAATILIVDDEELNRDMLSRRLERKGYSILVAENGRAALDTIMSRPIDLVVLDVMMPVMSGFEVLSLVRKAYPPADLPIIMATAKSDRDDIVGALDSGANDYVTKPIDFDVLIARIELQLRMRAARPSREKGAPVSAAEIEVGVHLDGKYRIEGALGVGSFGSVYRAIDLAMEREVAIKVLHDSVARRPDVLARFRREAISTCRVKHPNAIAVIDFGATQGGVAYMVMELLRGVSLERLLITQGRLTPARCAEILVPVAGLLREVHASGMIHRDIKPSNIFLESLHGQEVVKVLDFGIAKLVDGGGSGQQALTAFGAITGTPCYMAPERFGSGAYDHRSDIYSLGVCLYQMLEGLVPFDTQSGETLSIAMMHVNELPPPFKECRGQVGPEVEELVMDTLAKEPGLRPTAHEFARRLAAVAGRPDLAPPPEECDSGGPPGRA